MDTGKFHAQNFTVQVDRYIVWDYQIKALQAKVSRLLGSLKYAKKFCQNILSIVQGGIVELHFRLSRNPHKRTNVFLGQLE